MDRVRDGLAVGMVLLALVSTAFAGRVAASTSSVIQIAKYQTKADYDTNRITWLGKHGGTFYVHEYSAGPVVSVGNAEDGYSHEVVFTSPQGFTSTHTATYVADPPCWYFNGSKACSDGPPGSANTLRIFHHALLQYNAAPGAWRVDLIRNDVVLDWGTFELLTRSLIPTGGAGQRVELNSTTHPIAVKLVDYGGLSPTPGEPVSFSLVHTPSGVTGAGLISASSTIPSSYLTETTDTNGGAAVSLVVGDQEGMYVIQARTRSDPTTYIQTVVYAEDTRSAVQPPFDPSIVPTKNFGTPTNCPKPTVGNPVNIATGNKYQHEVDFQGSGPNPLLLARHYNSGPASAGGFGDHWRHTYDRRVVAPEKGNGGGKGKGGGNKKDGGNGGGNGKIKRPRSVYVERPDGRAFLFKVQKDGTWLTDPDVTDRLELIESGWLYVTDEDVREYYDQAGRLAAIETRAGLRQELSYDAAGHLVQVDDGFGRHLHFHYDSQGRLVAVDDPAGARFSYAYDAHGNLASVTYPDGYSRQYLYEQPEHPAALTGIVDETGARYATWKYDSAGRAVVSEHAGGAERVELAYAADGTTLVTDALGHQRTYGYGVLHGTVLVTGIENGGEGSCSGAVDYYYDENGGVGASVNALGVETRTHRDERGRVVARIEAVGTSEERTTLTTWLSHYDLPRQVQDGNTTTRYTYDGRGLLTQRSVYDHASGVKRTWQYEYDDRGLLIREDGPRTDVEDVTTYTYDDAGNLTAVRNALGQETLLLDYDAYGRPGRIRDPNGVETALRYDWRGNVVERNRGGETTTLEYDAAGRLKHVRGADGSERIYRYDAAGRLVEIVDEAGNRTLYQLDPQGRITGDRVLDASGALVRKTERTYDALGRLIAEIGAAGQVTAFDYDTVGNLLAQIDPNGERTSYTYDALDRRVGTVHPDGSEVAFSYDGHDNLIGVRAGNGADTRYDYNGFDEVVRESSPDAGENTYVYDAAGNLLTHTNGNGDTTRYTYDAIGRLTGTEYADTTGVSYTHDAGPQGIGRLSHLADASGSTSWQYDAHGRVLGQQRQVHGVGLDVSYHYDGAGRLTGVGYPSGMQVDYGYVGAEVESVSIDGVPLLTGVSHDPFGPISGWRWAGGPPVMRDWNADGRMRAFSLPDGEHTLGRDPAGQIRSLSGPGVQWLYDYDPLGRLVAANDSDGYSAEYRYDGNGNRLEQLRSDGQAIYEYLTGSNRLLSVVGGDATRIYAYDEAGNTLEDGRHSYRHDARNRLVGVDTQRAVYDYNALGQRVYAQTLDASGQTTTTRWAYDTQGRLLGAYGEAGEPREEIVWLGDLPVATVRDGVAYRIWPDHLGTPRAVTDESGTVLWRWGFDPFGEAAPEALPTADGVPFEFDMRFPGQYFDGEIGLHYNYFRDYDPSTGRYVESDPIGLKGGLNPFVYANNDPVALSDRLGLWAAAGTASGVGAGTAVTGGASGYASGVSGIVDTSVSSRYSGRTRDNLRARTRPNRWCPDDEPHCSMASSYQLQQAGVFDPHDFKEEYVGRPVSRYDICACDDGSIKIAGRGECGTSGPKIDTWARWR